MKPNTKEHWGMGLAYAFIVASNLIASDPVIGSLDQEMAVSGRTAVPVATGGQSASKSRVSRRLAGNTFGQKDSKRKARNAVPYLVEKVAVTRSHRAPVRPAR